MEFDGATIWLRQTLDSDIFYWKPDKWFKIWFYIVNRVNFKDNKQFKRGSAYIEYAEICLHTKASYNQVEKFVKWAKHEAMLEVSKSTRGNVITVLNYVKYQDSIKKKSEAVSEAKAKQKRSKSDAIVEECNNDKNDKNNILSEASSDEIPNLLKDKNKHIQIIGLYARAKGIEFENKKHQQEFIKRNVRAGNSLAGNNMNKIIQTMKYLKESADFKWNLESVGKYVEEDLRELAKKTLSVKDEKKYLDLINKKII